MYTQQRQRMPVTTREKHNQLWGGVKAAIERTWPVDRSSAAEVCSWTVSSTKISHIVMLSVGLESKFTHDTCSEIDNPWLITSGVVLNSRLKLHIQNDWNQRLAGRSMHQKTCPFMVYELVGGQYESRDLEVDDECIRVKIKDTTIWCHPPRFEVLEAVINESSKGGFKNAEGKFRKSVALLQVDSINQLPENVRNERTETRKTKMKQYFNQFYSYFEMLDWDDDKQYTSYRYPSLQLEVNRKYLDPAQTDNDRMRYGETFSGVYGSNANQVHHKFAVQGTEPVPMPTAEDIWNRLARRNPSLSLGSYSDVFNNTAPDDPNVAPGQEGQT